MKFESNLLLKDLNNLTLEFIRRAESMKDATDESLERRTSSDSWNALECLEHLNLYGDFYIPEINRRLADRHAGSFPDFKSGWLGNYFAKGMLPRENMKTMNTFADKNPLGQPVDRSTIERFLDQQRQMLEILERCKGQSLTNIRTSISISRWIKLRLGDTLRVVVYHNQRHMAQAEKALLSASSSG